MRLWSRLCNLVPAVIVENILWSTLLLVGVLNVLTWIVFSSYLVSDILLFPVFVWKVVEGVFCLVLLLFYTADWQVVLIFFFFFSCTGGKWKKDIYINTYNNYNYDCNKQKPRTISVGVQCLVSAVWTNLPVAWNLHLNHHPGNNGAQCGADSAADDVENGNDSPSDATLGEGTPVILRRSGRQRRPPEWLRSREFVLAHQVDKPEWQRKMDFLADLIKSGDIQMKSDDVVKLVCSIITKWWGRHFSWRGWM